MAEGEDEECCGVEAIISMLCDQFPAENYLSALQKESLNSEKGNWRATDPGY